MTMSEVVILVIIIIVIKIITIQQMPFSIYIKQLELFIV